MAVVLPRRSGGLAPLSRTLDALVGQLELLDCDLAPLRVEIGAVPLGGPGAHEVPPRHLVALLVEQHDRAVLALEVALDHVAVPVVEVTVVPHPPLERDVAVLRESGELPHRGVVTAFPVVFDIDRALEAGDFPERSAHDAVDLDAEPETTVRVLDLPGRHGVVPPRAREVAPPPRLGDPAA